MGKSSEKELRQSLQEIIKYAQSKLVLKYHSIGQIWEVGDMAKDALKAAGKKTDLERLKERLAKEKQQITKELKRSKKLWSQMLYAEVDEPPAFFEGQVEFIDYLLERIADEFGVGGQNEKV